MKNILFALTLLCGWCCLAPTLRAQNANCSDGTVTGSDTYSGTVFFNYGGIVNAFSVKNRTTASVGEPLLGDYFGQQYNGVAGFYSRFLLQPTPPLVTATEGDLKDRIQVDWAVDPLSPSPELGFNVYRDGAFIGHVEKEIRVFVDFNVEAGKFYNYQVTGVNSFGEGRKGSGLGFLNPNGVVTGQVKTFNGSPVADAEITLTPTLGAALEFTGDDVAFAEFSPAFLSTKWTVSCWVKIGAGNNNASILDFGSPTSKNWWLTTNGTAKGVKFNVGAQSLAYDFATDPDGWHHVAGVYSGTSLLLYVDGTLIGTVAAPIAMANLPLFFGRKPNGATNFFTGKLDEVRFFNRQLSQTEINQYKSRTVNSDAEGLAAYWKFDEGVGTKAYDISPNGHKAYLCGAVWTGDRSDVVNGAVTDETGFYKIEGINYGGGTIFTATPSKKVYTNYALEFNAANSEYTVLTDSVLLGATQQSSIEFWMQNFENIAGFRTVLANEATTGAPVIFRLNVTSGAISLNIGGVTKSYGNLGTGYQHIVVNLKKNGSTIDVSMYKNGTLLSTQNFATLMPDFGLQTWQVGARKTATGNDQFFSGLIDEVAFYDTTLTLTEIQTNFSQGLNPTHPRLRSWFPFNESRGTVVEDIGPARTGKGTVHGALWSNVTGISSATMHEFQPNKQLVTLNASNTSTDKIDFTDLSTVGVSGYVRFDGTNCFAEGVEILVNGQHYVPPVFTDADGKFVVDMEPGATATLTPTFKNHSFAPASWQVSNVVSPVAGILFRNLTKRTVRGQMAGNDRCRLDIIPDNAIVKVKVATLDGCFEKELSPNVDNGRYVFSNLPPLPVTVAVTQHSNNIIYDFFQLKGAQSSDLTEVNDTIDFIYYSPPEIEISALDANSCGQPMLEQSDMYTLDFRVFQPYEGGVCYLDTALLTIDNEFSDKPAFDTLMTTGKLRYRFPGGMPNLVPPHLKTLTIEATANDVSNTATTSAVVL
ncbi:MAG TPA: LamG domain-containing protein, partial [Saprospiraceae bacterium]|nr:LamG domain-containing protein [Saprospiraceae bacterium]